MDETGDSPLCRMCGTRNETISYMYILVSECGKLAQKVYKQRHDSVERFVHLAALLEDRIQ